MADVRALLKKEQAARRISHQYAIYSTKGALVCTVCNTQLKSESLWESHLRSTQHAMKLQRKKDTAAHALPIPTLPVPALTPAPEPTKRKRTDSVTEDSHKRSKQDGLPTDFYDGVAHADIAAGNISPIERRLPSRPATPARTTALQPSIQPASVVADVDEDEWAAFEADIAAAEAEPVNAVISAAPMTVDEIAAQAREQASAQNKEVQEAEAEGDKEDAARKLEDEFEEMKLLEMKVLRLKEMRQALKSRTVTDSTEGHARTTALPVPPRLADGADNHEGEDHDDDEDDDDDDDDEDEWDSFRIRA